MDLDALQRAYLEAWTVSSEIFAALPGAETLTRQYRRVPSSHDGEVEHIHLAKAGRSAIRVSIGFPDILGDLEALPKVEEPVAHG